MPNVLLPPTMSGRPLPTLLIDTGGWTVKHDTLMPNQNDTSEAVSASASTTTTATTTTPLLLLPLRVPPLKQMNLINPINPNYPIT
jgi:hypothetical protein